MSVSTFERLIGLKTQHENIDHAEEVSTSPRQVEGRLS